VTDPASTADAAAGAAGDPPAGATAPGAPAAGPDTELTARVRGAVSGAYELGPEMGRGGMGVVYRARDRRLKRQVAVKVLPPELAYRAEIRTRFLREAETAAQLTHPHIVPIYAVDEADGLVFFVMACIDGENLGKRLHDRGPMPVDDVRRVLAEVADALAYAHARGVVHRDIKPDNILLDHDGDRAMVTDFGIARAVIEGSDARLTATGMAIGTPAYMSPEQSAGDREVDGRSDLYSLGVVAYQMLAGVLPFQATSTPAMLIKHLSERPVPVDQRRPDCPPDLAAAVMRMLEKDPAARFASADELEAVLLGQRAIPTGSYHTTQPPGARAGAAPLPPGPGGAPLAPAPAPPAAAPERGGRLGAFGVTVAWGGDGRRLAEELDGGPRGVARAPTNAPDTGDVDLFAPTADELARWEAGPVRDFRRKFGWYAVIGSVLLLFTVLGDRGFFPWFALWTLYIAYRYAKLWSDGFDWHDILRQPRDRLFADVVAEWGDDVQAVYDPDKRARVRERQRRRRIRRAAWETGTFPSPDYANRPGANVPALGAPASGAPAPGAPAPGAPAYGGSPAAPPPLGGYPQAAAPAPAAPAGSSAALGAGVRQAAADRDEIVRLVGTMPKGERERLGDVAGSARALAARVEALAGAVAQLDRDAAPGAAGVLEAEIVRLEAEANPLDRAASDGRVKRLAYLKRQRRAVADLARRRDAAAAALEHCRVALETMRVDLVRLRTGATSPAQVTTLAERAMVLAREVDGIVGAAGEVARATAPGQGPGGGPSGVGAPPAAPAGAR
jgi:serine/threonine-protein kinase